MSSSRDAWSRLKALFNEACALPEDRRASYLASACAGDQELRSEAERLLAAYEIAEDFLEQPAAQVFSHLFIAGLPDGLTIGPYQIGARIGVGGMGDVYKALDTRLGRHVAIKVLRAHLAADPLGRGRFEREARAVAALNHPHICTLYDVGTQDGVNFLVMEFLEGETLAARLASGPVPLLQALEYAAQIASALDKAHRAGIVHRDLKPGNVMLTPGGAKLLDFGLAKPHGTGHLVYGVNGALQVVPFDLERLEVSARPIALTDAVLTTPFGGTLDFDISANGTMVYVPAAAPPIGRHMVWVDRQGREESIRAPVRAYTYPRMSPDGRRVAIDTRDQENDVWIWDFSREILTRLTFGLEFDQYPVWVGPGNRLVFGCSRNGIANLFWRAATGDGGDEQLVRSKNPQFPHTISPDGSRVVYREDAPSTGQDLMVVSLGGDRRPQPLLQTSFNELNAEISPDGRWIAYETNETGDYEVFVRPFPNVGDGKWQVSAGGGHKPLWARDGRELFYLSPAGALMSVRTEQAATFAVAGPTRILEGGRYFTGSGITTGRTYDVSPDGQRFLMLQTPAGAPTSLTVVQHWFSELKRLTPPNAR